MGIDLYAEKLIGNKKIQLCFGRSYYYKSENSQSISDMNFDTEMDDIEKNKEKLEEEIKGYVKYSPKSIEDAHNATEDMEGVLESLLDEERRLGSLVILQNLKEEGFAFIEE